MGKLKSSKDIERTLAVDRLIWFKYAIPDDVKGGDSLLAHDLAQQYIDRNSEEIASLTAEHRVGRPKNGKLVMLEMLRGKDKQEYNVGMKIPDVLDAANVAVLKAWEGDYNAISRIKMMEVRMSENPKTLQQEQQPSEQQQ